MVNQTSREVVYFKLPVAVADLIIHISTLLFLLNSSAYVLMEGAGAIGNDFGVYFLLMLSYWASIGIFGLRLHERKINLYFVLWRAVLQTALTCIFFSFLVAILYKVVPRHLFLSQFLVTLPLIALWHLIANRAVRLFRRLGRNTRSVVIIGADENSLRLYGELVAGQSTTGYKVAGFFTSLEHPCIPADSVLLGCVDDFFSWIETHRPDEIYCSLPPSMCQNEVNHIIRICNSRFIEFFFVPTMDGYPHRQMSFENFGKVTIIKLRDEPLNSPFSKSLKRGFDILASGLFLCTIYPFVLLFVWLGDRITGDSGPLYFKQARTGYNGKSFMIYKFRSMKVNADADTLQATENDPRKTRFGDFLRRSSIDELPQMINVFKGDMSLIGPRPHMEYQTEYYSALISDYMVRHLVKPGITGWAQINGCRGETRKVGDMVNRVEHDIWYIEHWTPLLDAEIFLKTLWQVLPGHDKQAY